MKAAAVGLEVEWVVVCDGEDLPLEDAATIFPNLIKVVLPKRYGAAVARNTGLATATAQWVTSLDDDDLLPEDSLRSRLEAANNNNVSWVGGLLTDYFPETGTFSLWDAKTPRGHVPAGVLKKYGEPRKVNSLSHLHPF